MNLMFRIFLPPLFIALLAFAGMVYMQKSFVSDAQAEPVQFDALENGSDSTPVTSWQREQERQLAEAMSYL
jgi:hypothetical protein